MGRGIERGVAVKREVATGPQFYNFGSLSRDKINPSFGCTEATSAKSLDISDLGLLFMLTNRYGSGILSANRRGRIRISSCSKTT